MKRLIALVVLTAFLSGCQTTVKNDDAEPVVAKGDCIQTRTVTAYYSQNAPYWTDQRLVFCPAAVRLDAEGTEPEGGWQARYSRGQFSASGLTAPRIRALPAGLMDATLAELVYYSFTAGGGFVPAAMGDAQEQRLMGKRYAVYVVAKTGKRTVSLYKNLATEQYELVRIADNDRDWMAVSYNPRYSERFRRTLPRKIDVFDVSGGVAAKQLVVQYEFVEVQ